MARSKDPKPSRGKPSVAPESGIELLSGQINKARQLLDSPPIQRDHFLQWKNTTRNFVEMAFGENHPNISSFDHSGVFYISEVRPGFVSGGSNLVRRSSPLHYAEKLDGMISALNGYIEQLQVTSQIQKTSTPAALNVEREPSKKVFIVHGHNDELKYEIAHSLQSAGLDVTILHKEANEGRTLLEKFADYAGEAGFAVVLLTADDVGGKKGASPDSFQPRARQNVVFELGFFFGLLGRGKVCAVYESGVEEPSDLHGLAKVQHDPTGRWIHDVAKEIYAAGIPVDFSKL